MKNYHSKNKDFIVDFFASHPDHAYSAKDIYASSLADRKMNLATVYRNLEKLSEEGILQKRMKTDGEEALYQYMGEHCHEHLHMICSSCGKIIHLDCRFMGTLQEHLFEDHGFVLEAGDSVLRGICQECQKKG